MSKRAVLYARVSTVDQSDRGYSLPSQLDFCRKYAERFGYSVVAELTEDVSGAIPIAERPEGAKLAVMLNAGQADAIIAYQIDRLYRDNIELLIAVRQWLRAGIEVHACDVGRIEDENNIILLIKGWQASDERAKIRERSMRGKRAKALAGKVVGTRPPYGYRHIRDANGRVVTLEIDERTGRIVRLIYHWYVYGDESGKRLSAMAIARRLSEMRTPTPGELNRGYHRKRAAGMWQSDKVVKILTHEVYAGIWRFGGRIGSTRKMRPLDEQIPVSVPAIIDRETWERAQAQRLHNKAMAKRNAKRDYLLRGLIRCGCEQAMCGNFFSDHRYYTCAWKQNHFSTIEERTCHARSVRADAIEADVWDEIKELFGDLDRLSNELKRAQQEELDAQIPKCDELQAVEGLVKQADEEAREIAAALPKAKGRVGETLQAQADEVNARYDSLVQRRAELMAELAARKLTDGATAEIVQFARDVQEGIQNADTSTKRRTLESLDLRVTAKEGQYYLKCILGETEGDAIREIKRLGKVGIVNDSSTQCTSPRASLSTTTSPDCTAISTGGSKSSRRTSRRRNTRTTTVKTTPTRT